MEKYPTRIVTNGEKFSIEYLVKDKERVGIDWPRFWQDKYVEVETWYPINNPTSLSTYPFTRYFGSRDIRMKFNSKQEALDWLESWNKSQEKEVWKVVE